MKFHKPLAFLACLGASIALLPSGTAYALADANIDPGTSDGRPLSATAFGEVLARNADGTTEIAWGCAALAPGDTASTWVRCSLVVNGSNFRNLSQQLAGPAAAASTVSFNVPSGSYSICYRADAAYVTGDSKPLPIKCFGI